MKITAKQHNIIDFLLRLTIGALLLTAIISLVSCAPDYTHNGKIADKVVQGETFRSEVYLSDSIVKTTDFTTGAVRITKMPN